jgi:hypothetical protein
MAAIAHRRAVYWGILPSLDSWETTATLAGFVRTWHVGCRRQPTIAVIRMPTVAGDRQKVAMSVLRSASCQMRCDARGHGRGGIA